MYGKNGHTIKTYLSSVNDNVGCIYVIWNIINPNKDINGKLTNEFSIEKNVKRINYDLIHNLSYNIKNANDFGKSIVRTSMLIDSVQLWLHKIRVNGVTINNYGENKNYYDNGNDIKCSENIFSNLNITLNHYAIRNADDYLKKQKQIDVVSIKNRFIQGLFEMIELDDSYFIIDKEI
jgi:hypothetical protein